VRVARLVMETPHLLLCGEGATAFARFRGIPDFYPVSERARTRYALVRGFFARGGENDMFVAWEGRDPAAYWNFPDPVAETLRRAAGPSDTVGAVVRDGAGRFGVGLSTGGTSIMLLGRVGDTPIIGAGLYAGPHGAVAATGDGEEIMRRVLAKQVYDWIAAGSAAQDAVERGVGAVDAKFTIGLIAVSATGEGIADNRTMPAALCRA
jgi:L-asparaginase/beta-aspartyl-peptidase (threonine type)